jgi:hypothetical protein
VRFLLVGQRVQMGTIINKPQEHKGVRQHPHCVYCTKSDSGALKSSLMVNVPLPLPATRSCVLRVIGTSWTWCSAS